MKTLATMRSANCVSCLLLLLVAAVLKVSSAKFIHGKEAEKMCQAYKKICPRGKVCAIQTIQIPRPVKFPVCVHRYQIKVRSLMCQQAPSPGRCSARFRRWYYNVHMAACSWFTYGGCGGNDNNFRSREECERVCVTGQDAASDVSFDDASDRFRESGYVRHSDRRHHDNRHHFRRHPTTHKTPRDSYIAERHRASNDNNNSNNDRQYRNDNSQYRRSRNDNTDVTDSSYARTNQGADARNNQGADARTNQGAHARTNQGDASKKDKPPLSVYDAPYYAYTTTSTTTTTRPYWADARDSHADGHRNRWKAVSTRKPPLELRRPPEERRRIRKKLRPRYHPRHQPSNRPAALQSKPASGRPVPENGLLSDWGLSGLPSRASGMAKNTLRLIEFPDRRVANFSDKARRLTESRHLAVLAAQVPRLPTANIRRRVSGRREPPRSISLMSRRPYNARASVRASELTGVRAGMVSSLTSSYAPGARESVRRFPSRRQRKRGRGLKRRNRRRRRKNGKRGRRNRSRKGKKSANIHENRAENSNSTRNSSMANSIRGVSGRFAEFRHKKVSFWPMKTQSDEANEKRKEEVSKLEEEEELQRKRRRRRRRKGKGKRKQRGRKRGRDDSEDSPRGSVSPPPEENQYYDKVHLFSLLDTAGNKTESMT